MTDRYNALTVVLKEDIRADDAQGLIHAIKHFYGVADVRPQVATPEDHIALVRARQELADEIIALGTFGRAWQMGWCAGAEHSGLVTTK